MYMFWFYFSLAGFLLILVPYYISLDHDNLDKWFGEKSRLVGDVLGFFSGWGLFGFWIGLWISPQIRFQLGFPFLRLWNIKFTWINTLLSVFFLAPAIWFGLKGIAELGLKVSETHHPKRIVTTSVYSVVRHPQYLGGLLGHFGVSIFLGSLDSLLISPVVIAEIYLLCRIEERMLVKEFGLEYQHYQREVPMLIPRR